MRGEHSFTEHWRRGALFCVMLAVVVIGTALLATLAVGLFVVLQLELFISETAAETLEDTYIVPAIIALTCVVLPAFLSQTIENGTLKVEWPEVRAKS